MANTDESQQTVDKLPSPAEFFLTVPLYESFVIGSKNYTAVARLMYFEGTVDAYCVDCGQHSIFTNSSYNYKNFSEEHALSEKVFDVPLICTRNAEHKIFFLFRILHGRIIKIGQHPALAEFHFPDIRKYRKVLGDQRFREFSRGIGLSSHGIGVGAFVYLRRIFEDLIESAHQIAKQDTAWDEDKYIKSRMDEKIPLLKSLLPAFLSENASLYSILSKGIHSLTEEECLQYFQAVKIAIELILDEKLEQEEKRRKAEIARKAISNIHSSLK